MAYRPPLIANLKHYVTLCTMQDVVEHDGQMSLSRKGVYKTWAEITMKRSSQHATDGYAVHEPRNSRTHIIVTRYRADIDISSAAWIYEPRRISPSRWFKVIGAVELSECGNFMTFDVMLHERGEGVTKPTTVDREQSVFEGSQLPSGVEL